MTVNQHIDDFIAHGCGRCEYYDTPDCKVINWRKEIIELRRIVLQTDLQEDFKWKQPCYTFSNKNVVIISALKDHPFLSFFKGVLLKDKAKQLVKPGPNSQSDRYMIFKDVETIRQSESLIKSYIAEAIELEKAGKKVEFKQNPETMPEELIDVFNKQPELRSAFEALTPGRQRGYILYFSAAKQSQTRYDRIKKYNAKILSGKGFHDR